MLAEKPPGPRGETVTQAPQSPGGCPGSQKTDRTATFSVVTYIETTKASSTVKSIDRGTMMWADQAVEFFQTLTGGSLSKAAAEAKWKSISDSAKADGTQACFLMACTRTSQKGALMKVGF